MKTYSLRLTGPHSFLSNHEYPSVFKQRIDYSGIYLWTVHFDGKYYINYVGKSTNISERLHQHIAGFLSGKYVLYNPVLFAQLQKEQIYGRTNLYPEDFLEHYLKLTPQLYNMLGSYRIFTAELNDSNNTLEEVESLIIENLRTFSETTKNFLDNDRLSRVPNQMTVQFDFPDSVQIEGLSGGKAYTV